MEMPRRVAIACLFSALACLCHGLESDDKASSDKRLSGAGAGFGSRSNRAPFGFGRSFDTGPNLRLGDFGNWKAKRTFGPTEYHKPDGPNLAIWNSWKRNFSPDGSFHNLGQGDGSMFQSWRDWMAKRGFQPGKNPFDGNAFARGYQGLTLGSWPDFAKRGGVFGTGFHQLGSNDKLQSWGDWMKRAMGAQADSPFGNTFLKPRPYFLTWEDLYKRANDNRQFKAKSGFGGSRQYFADGLQDWRSTFQGLKRAEDPQKEEKN